MSKIGTRQRLIKRLSWYYPTEGFNALLGTGALAFVLARYGLRNSILLGYGLLVVIVILVQGTYYWERKLRVLQGKPVNHGRTLRLFRLCERANLGLIIGMPVAAGVQWLAGDGAFTQAQHLPWALAACGFAILEHINYYHRQLTQDNVYDLRYLARNRRLKVASLRKDLRDGFL